MKVDNTTKERIKDYVISALNKYEPDIIHLNVYAIDIDIVKEIEKYRQKYPGSRLVYTIHSLAFQDFSRSPDDKEIFNIKGDRDDFVAEVIRISEELHFSPISSEEKIRKMKELLQRYNIPINEDVLQRLDIRTYMIALQNKIFKISDKVVFVSDYLRKSAYENDILREVIKGKDSIVYNGTKMYKVYDENIDSIRRKVEGWRKKYRFEDKFIVGYVGRITKSKGILDLILTVDYLIKEGYTDIILILSGKVDEYLEEEITQKFGYLIGRHLFFFKEEELPKPFSTNEDKEMAMIHAAFDLEVYPSLYEPFGLVPLEAVSCNTPTIVRRIDNLSEFEKDGIAEAFDTVNELKSLILKYRDVKYRKNIKIDEKREIVREKYGIDRMRKEYMDIFREVMGELYTPIYVTS